MISAPPVAVAPASRATILVVDDSAENITLMHALLKDAYRVRSANGAEKALRIAGSDDPPDLILLDISMPGIDGYEVCRRLGAAPRTAKIPVIFLTARAEEEDERKGLELGAVDYISKPFSPPIVLARVKNHLALKAMADHLQRQNVELERARALADKANRAKSDFLSRMSHELRSPLNAIIGFAQLLETEKPPPSTSELASITQILQSGWYLLELINEILDLAVIEAGRITLTVEAVPLEALAVECQEMVAASARQLGITLAAPAITPGLTAFADRTRLKQVVINLLSNAIKYNRRGGEVRLACTATAAGRVRLTVTDTGEGLPPEKVAQLFESFNRLGQEQGGEQGTGIGLVVSKRLVELMGGRIGAESTVGVGCTFWLELEAGDRPTEFPGDAVARTLDVDATVAEGVSHTILYVEDNPANLRQVEQLVGQRPGLRLLSAGDATYGIELARSVMPDLILMDINLPGISGYDALALLRADPITREIPVVALSARAMPHDLTRGLAAGFFRYITKPIRLHELMETIDAALAVSATAERRFP